MGLVVSSQHERLADRLSSRASRFFSAVVFFIALTVPAIVFGQLSFAAAAEQHEGGELSANSPSSHTIGSRRFLGGRTLVGNTPAAQAMDAARQKHAAMLVQQAASPQLSSLSAPWQAVGPNQVASIAYGNVTGRVTAIAIDPADPTGNTVYLGTTGGGVWKSINAAGPSVSVAFVPLTDTLPVFSPNAGTAAIPSLSIGAISIHSGVILAGTGDPNDASDSFYGSGLLRSADNGVTWTLIQESQDGIAGNHLFTGLGFAGFAWSTATPGTVVAAVSQAAEGVLVNAADATNSVMGLYYSTDAGVTWQMSTIMDGSQPVQTPQFPSQLLGGRAATAVVWNSVRQRFYGAIRYHGYYESADGVTWTRLTNQPGQGLTAVNCPTDPTSLGSPSCPIFRGALAVQANTGDTFALTVDQNNLDQGLWQDVCGLSGANCGNGIITFSRQLPSAALEIGNGSTVVPEADYNLALAAAPLGPAGSTQDTILYAGTTDLFRCSLAAGCVLRDTTNALNGCAAPAQVAPAQHAIATMATASQPLVYLGNDGGLWRSTDGVNQQSAPCSFDDATHFQNLNGGLGSLAEVISFAQHPTDAGTLLVGLGANGTAATASSGASSWPQLSTGEGGTVGIDQKNPSLWYVSTASGVSIRQCSKGTGCSSADFVGTPTIGPAQVDGDNSVIDAPWLLDPALPSNVLIGTCRVWRGPASGGSSWPSSNAISSFLAGPQGTSCVSTNPVLRSLAAGGVINNASSVQDSGSPVLYAGMAGKLDGGGSAGGHLYSITTAGTASSATTWADLATSPVTNSQGTGFNPGGFDLSAVAVDSHDASGKTVYATVMGFVGNGINTEHLYRSIDAGAHWSNISSNLPNAPANSVVVDPNDANTLYVAMDTGVYVTTAVTTCTIANCWSVYGIGLPNAPVVELAAAPAMATGDGRTGELRAATYGRGLWQIPLVTAAIAAQPTISLNPTSLTYSAQPIGNASAAQIITVTNMGLAPLTISQIAVTGDFTETANCVAGPIAINSTCTIQVVFLPTATGGRSGVLTVYGNVAGGQATATLSGTGLAAAAIVLDPVVLTFPSTTLNATSPVQNITISNTSNSAVGLQRVIVNGGDFRITVNTCGPSLGPGVGCTVGIAFTPSASGTRIGTLAVTDDAGTQTASLSGVGTSPATDALSPLTLTFGAQQVDTASATQQITLSNTGDLPLTLIAAQVTSGDFTVVNACGNSLNPHSTCSMNVAFAPKDVGPLSGVLSISDQYRTQTVTLNGTGIAPPGVSLAPFSMVVFPPTGVGLQSASQTITLTNNVGAPLSIQGISLTGDFVILPNSSTCGATVAPDAACVLQVAFAPTVGGPRTGSLTVTDSAGNSPQALSLTGPGVDFTLTTNGITSVTIMSGQNAVFPLLLSSASNVSGTAKFTCSGMPANSTCNITPSNIPLGSTTTVSVTVLTGVASASSNRPFIGRSGVILFVALFPLGLLVLRPARRSSVAGFALLCLLLAASGCGVGREIPLTSGSNPGGPSGPPTAAGTYTVVAAATSAGLTRSVNLTLIVQ
ncbi:choice-of-anchor D domain-containing protein [Tunturibacter empetritectus]|uniref:Choice-of-anchor D domain-containing protein n=1 Tax=Tunturiibacter empetritectus TaxID=3069691 RepID=A0AAU7ZHZ3_9BACT